MICDADKFSVSRISDQISFFVCNAGIRPGCTVAIYICQKGRAPYVRVSGALRACVTCRCILCAVVLNVRLCIRGKSGVRIEAIQINIAGTENALILLD